SASERSWILSPEVVIFTSSAPPPILSRTHPAWTSASFEPLVPIRTCCAITPRPLPQGAPRGNGNKGFIRGRSALRPPRPRQGRDPQGPAAAPRDDAFGKAA